MDRCKLYVTAPVGTVLELGDPHLPDGATDPTPPTALEQVFGLVTRNVRFVHDCSYPRGVSTNNRTPAANHAPAICPTHIKAFLYIVTLCVELGDPHLQDEATGPAASTALERTMRDASYVVFTPSTIGTLVRRRGDCGVGMFEYRAYV